jgi:hypothetical protein
MAREIPEGSIEIQTGLYLYEYTKTIGGRDYTFRRLYSAEGYCFYDLAQVENYVDGDITGELLPPEQRVYSQYTALAIIQSTWTYEQINAQYISVPVQDGYEIVSVGGGNVTA